MGMTFFAENLEQITAVTKALNELDKNTAVGDAKDFYIYVELREQGSHRKVGEWSDEIGPGSWYFEETPLEENHAR